MVNGVSGSSRVRELKVVTESKSIGKAETLKNQTSEVLLRIQKARKAASKGREKGEEAK